MVRYLLLQLRSLQRQSIRPRSGINRIQPPIIYPTPEITPPFTRPDLVGSGLLQPDPKRNHS